MKKLTLILLAIVTCISLAACSGEGGTTTEPEETVETSDVGETTVFGTDETTEEVFTGYKVTVTDASGNPIAGVQIQMCDSKGCRMPVPTDEDGTVKFNYDESDYHVLIAAAVEGYVVNTSEEYYFENGGKELTIVLEKAS